MFCIYCGADNPHQATFCANCGRQLERVASTPVPDMIPPTAPLPGVLASEGHPPVGNAPMVQGTRQASDIPPAQEAPSTLHSPPTGQGIFQSVVPSSSSRTGEAPSVQPFEVFGADIYAPQRTPPPGSQGPCMPLPPPFGQQNPFVAQQPYGPPLQDRDGLPPSPSYPPTPQSYQPIEHPYLPASKGAKFTSMQEFVLDTRGRRLQVSKETGVDDNTAIVTSIRLTTPGRKGFAGIGKKPNQYEAEVLQPAVVSVTYRTKAKISAKIGEKKEETKTIYSQVQVLRNGVLLEPVSVNAPPSPGFVPGPGYAPVGAYPTHYAVPMTPPERGRGVAVAGLVLGIISLVVEVVIVLWPLGVPIAIVGIILSAMGRRSFSRRKMATWGLVLSIIALVLSLFFTIITISTLSTHPSR